MCGALKPRFILHIDVEIITNTLSIWGIFGKRKEIHEMIMDLHDQEYLDKDILPLWVGINQAQQERIIQALHTSL